MAKNIPPKARQEGADTTRDFDGIQMAARESWERFHVDRVLPGEENPRAEEMAHSWLNTAALVAKLFQADPDLLAGYGSLWVSSDLVKAFKTHTKGNITKHILKQAQILAAANYILIAGDVYAKDIAIKTTRVDEITAERWREWTSNLEEMADAVDEDARWDLKARLQKAHDMMVEIQQVL